LIGFSIYTLAIVGAAFLPVIYFVELDLTAQFALRSFGVMYYYFALSFAFAFAFAFTYAFSCGKLIKCFCLE